MMATSKRPSKTAKHKPTHKPAPKPTHKPTPVHKGPPPAAGQPVFAQPKPSPDPTGFVDTTSDSGDYSLVNATLLQAVPGARGGAVEPVLTLTQVLGSAGAAEVAKITK